MVSGYAALPANEGEDVFAWIRRQTGPTKPQAPEGIGAQPQPSRATTSAMFDALNKKIGRAGTRPIENDSSHRRNQS